MEHLTSDLEPDKHPERPQNPTPSVPEAFGRYRILERLGQGGMAEVYRVQLEGQDDFRKRLALKVILPHVAMQPEYRKWFVREARLTAMLESANVVSTYDYGIDHDRLFLVMEYVEGVDLAKLWHAHQAQSLNFPTPVALQLAAEICRGLKDAHTATDESGNPLSMVHRDLKPSNILISWKGSVKIGDFGVARAEHCGDQTVQGLVKGTVRYMSPEQARGELLDARSDLFSLGVILFELLTMERFYPEERSPLKELQHAQKAHLGGKLKTLNRLPVGVAIPSLLSRALARTPSQRFSSAAEMLAALEDALDDVRPRPNLERWLETLPPEVETRLGKQRPSGSHSNSLAIKKEGSEPTIPPRTESGVGHSEQSPPRLGTTLFEPSDIGSVENGGALSISLFPRPLLPEDASGADAFDSSTAEPLTGQSRLETQHDSRRGNFAGSSDTTLLPPESREPGAAEDDGSVGLMLEEDSARPATSPNLATFGQLDDMPEEPSGLAILEGNRGTVSFALPSDREAETQWVEETSSQGDSRLIAPAESELRPADLSEAWSFGESDGTFALEPVGGGAGLSQSSALERLVTGGKPDYSTDDSLPTIRVDAARPVSPGPSPRPGSKSVSDGLEAVSRLAPSLVSSVLPDTGVVTESGGAEPSQAKALEEVTQVSGRRHRPVSEAERSGPPIRGAADLAKEHLEGRRGARREQPHWPPAPLNDQPPEILEETVKTVRQEAARPLAPVVDTRTELGKRSEATRGPERLAVRARPESRPDPGGQVAPAAKVAPDSSIASSVLWTAQGASVQKGLGSSPGTGPGLTAKDAKAPARSGAGLSRPGWWPGPVAVAVSVAALITVGGVGRAAVYPRAVIHTYPETAEVLLDGQVVARGGQPFHYLSLAGHRLEVRAPGYQARTHEVAPLTFLDGTALALVPVGRHSQ